MSYLVETHFHTPLTSHCGVVHPADAIPQYIAQGYSAIIVTDHYYRDWFYEEQHQGLTWAEKIDRWLAGYRAALSAAEGTDLRIYLGMELRFTDSINDHLVYGIDAEFLKSHPELYDMTPGTFYRLAEENGLFFAQAHPFRSVCFPRNPAHLHGVEIFNGNVRWNSHNDVAYTYGATNGLVLLSGSDFHEKEDACRGGIYLEELPVDEKALAQQLLQGGVKGWKVSAPMPEHLRY